MRFWIPLVVVMFLVGLAVGALWEQGPKVVPASEHVCRDEQWSAYIAGILRDVLETNPAFRKIIEQRFPPLPPIGLECRL